MSVKKFKFVSPGVFLKEIDQSQIPKAVAPIGPTIIGRSKRGPALIPTKVSSYSEFVELFGEPVPGGDVSTDGWRDGNNSSPTYGAYAAQAWLANSETVNFVRLLGSQDDQATGDSNNTGKTGWKIGSHTVSAPVGAYGLFVFPSSSTAPAASLSGTLAAIWYCTGSVPVLSGTLAAASSTTQSNGALLKAEGGKYVVYMSGSGSLKDLDRKFQFSFNESSGDFIRKVFNTNPRAVDKTKGADEVGPSPGYGYWLGETFENRIYSNTGGFGTDGSQDTSTSVSSTVYAAILPLATYNDHLGANPDEHAARTGWFFRQSKLQGPGSNDTNYSPQTVDKLFRFIAIDGGDWTRNNLKVEIANIKPPVNDLVKYGSFDVILRDIKDVDNNRKPLESFTGCNLNPSSPDFIARKIGDVYYVYDSAKQRLIRQKNNENNSRYIRVEMHPGFDPSQSEQLPFGVLGPLRPKAQNDSWQNIITGSNHGFIGTASGTFGYDLSSPSAATGSLSSNLNIKLTFPKTLTRVSSSEDGLSNYKLASFGFKSSKSSGSFVYNEAVGDLLRMPGGSGARSEFASGVAENETEYSWYFTLDEVVRSGSSSNVSYYYESGSKAKTVSGSFTAASGTYLQLLNEEKVNSFCSPLQGGTDGFNVFEKEPLRNLAISEGSTAQTSYIYNTYKRAIDSVKDPEVVETNLISVPGLVHEPLTLYLLQAAEERGDCLAVIDLSADNINSPSYIPPSEKSIYGNNTELDRTKDAQKVVDRIKDRNLNSSYGAAYYPWVEISDDTTGQIVPIPPSVVAIGAMSYTDNVQAPWFAPAGFNRGGLSLGNSGLTVVNSVYRLSADERDLLYEANVNPIATFPSEGLVIFGQKTLQTTRSALDRINVRRLLIFVKRGISLIAKDVLFEPNVEQTWNNFVRRADPFLADVKARFGVTDFRIVLDSTTTTPDLIDQNIMYAKIFIKPARAIEYIAVDFFITNTGASFAD